MESLTEYPVMASIAAHFAKYDKDRDRRLSLDDAIEYLSADELLEVTPESLRIRKKELNQLLRERAVKRANAA